MGQKVESTLNFNLKASLFRMGATCLPICSKSLQTRWFLDFKVNRAYLKSSLQRAKVRLSLVCRNRTLFLPTQVKEEIKEAVGRESVPWTKNNNRILDKINTKEM
jgi:hypothetical protein